MLTMHPTLLIGPADWDPVRMPKEEFRARIEALWRQDSSAGGAIVYGDSRQHGDLAYLTNFTPKLEPAIALIPRNGAPRLLVGGGANMLPAAKPLTWIETLLPLRNAGKSIAEWARALPGGNRLLLIGGDHMRHPMHRDIVGALGADVTLRLVTARRMAHAPRNSAHEIVAIRDSCRTLAVAVAALEEARRAGAGATGCILAAEHAAYGNGAQDVRTLFSLDDGRTLRPFSLPVEQRIDPFQVYIAVRKLGYWAEGFVMLAEQPPPPLEAVRSALRSAVACVRPGIWRRELADAIAEAIKPHRPHVITADRARMVVDVDLSLDSSPRDDKLIPGEVLSLRAGIADDAAAAIVSAMVLIEEHSHGLLWSSLDVGALP